MCGIVGYVGSQRAAQYVLDGLRRLEYRGYDSAGIAAVSDGQIVLRRRKGKLCELSDVLAREPVAGQLAIGHTRWATHGRVTDENAHPHVGGSGEVVVVHNGVIENYSEIKTRLEACGYEFHSQTDTEVAAHQIEHYLKTGVDVTEAALAIADAALKKVGAASLAYREIEKKGIFLPVAEVDWCRPRCCRRNRRRRSTALPQSALFSPRAPQPAVVISYLVHYRFDKFSRKCTGEGPWVDRHKRA